MALSALYSLLWQNKRAKSLDIVNIVLIRREPNRAATGQRRFGSRLYALALRPVVDCLDERFDQFGIELRSAASDKLFHCLTIGFFRLVGSY